MWTIPLSSTAKPTAAMTGAAVAAARWRAASSSERTSIVAAEDHRGDDRQRHAHAERGATGRPVAGRHRLALGLAVHQGFERPHPGPPRADRAVYREAEKLRTKLLSDADELKIVCTKSTVEALLERWMQQHEIDPANDLRLTDVSISKVPGLCIPMLEWRTLHTVQCRHACAEGTQRRRTSGGCATLTAMTEDGPAPAPCSRPASRSGWTGR